MKILFEHTAVLPVKKYGGTERVLFWLMKELVRMGHGVFLLGHPHCQVSHIGVTLIPRNVKSTSNQDELHSLFTKLSTNVDIIHFASTPPFTPDFPYVVTIHGNGQPGEKFLENTVFVSRKHAENHNAEIFVYNGIDLEEYPFHKHKKSKTQNWDKFLFLAKANWKVKNLTDCVRTCRATGKTLAVAGGWQLSFSRYIRYHGMVNQTKKLLLLQESDALLWPVRWHEPFGIAVIEAMAMGIPVVGSSYGSMPELIKEGINGVICQNYDDFEFTVRQRQAPTEFNPEDIRKSVEENFSAGIMAHNYLQVYEQILNEQHLHNHKPFYGSTKSPETLLDF